MPRTPLRRFRGGAPRWLASARLLGELVLPPPEAKHAPATVDVVAPSRRSACEDSPNELSEERCRQLASLAYGYIDCSCYRFAAGGGEGAARGDDEQDAR